MKISGQQAKRVSAFLVTQNFEHPPQREHIYFNNQPVAFVTNGTIYYIHTDHLNTPQVVTDQNQQVVWVGDYQPFGKLADTTSQTNSIELYSRFPGQYLDSETGLYYNYFRDYDPSIGRYIQSDPIGLEGGINTYAYVEGNPIVFFDFNGLAKQLSLGISASLFSGLIGGGGGSSVGVSVPNNLTDFECYQIFVTADANLQGGIGYFAGVGLTFGFTNSDGPIVSGTTSGIITTGNAGVGKSIGVGFTAEGSALNLNDWENPINGSMTGIFPKVGVGLGLSVGVGQYTASTYASPVGG